MAQFESLEILAETIENEGNLAVEQAEEILEPTEEEGDEDTEEVEPAEEEGETEGQ